MKREESTSLGAAALGAVALGLYGSVGEACGAVAEVRRVYEPDPANRDVYDRGFATFRSVYARLKGLAQSNAGNESVADSCVSAGGEQ
jgi:xylulokinase